MPWIAELQVEPRLAVALTPNSEIKTRSYMLNSINHPDSDQSHTHEDNSRKQNKRPQRSDKLFDMQDKQLPSLDFSMSVDEPQR